METLPSSSPLPQVIAFLNGSTLFLLILGFILVKQKKIRAHKICMGLAVMNAILFLACYLLYHYQVGSVPYPHHDWTRILYFMILIPHTILAIAMLPFVFLAVRYGLTHQIEKHKKVVRWLFPVWVYVSATGLVVYFMLYHL